MMMMLLLLLLPLRLVMGLSELIPPRNASDGVFGHGPCPSCVDGRIDNDGPQIGQPILLWYIGRVGGGVAQTQITRRT